jgi:phosphogluconate dehydratase
MHPRLLEITERIRDRSRDARAEYLARMEAARDQRAARGQLGCAPANWRRPSRAIST